MRDMTIKEYDAMVRRLEEYARQSPRAYRLRVGALAASCYAYIAVVVIGVLALVGLICLALFVRFFLFAKLALYVGIPALMLLASVGRALWVRLDPPNGTPITRARAPQLFAMIEEVREALSAKKIHHVLITDDYNAAAYQHPKLGLLGWPENYLMLGLPLMMSLSADELRSVIGHELGHMAGDHSRFGNWIYRQRMTLRRLAAELGDDTSFLFRPLFNRFIPFFNAYSFALARANEYEADEAAARVTSAPVAARALARVHADGAWLDATFWGELKERNKSEEKAPKKLFFHMNEAFASERETGEHLERALERMSSFSDTHPSLTERLEALGQPDVTLGAREASAADSLLPQDTLVWLCSEFSANWLGDVGELWTHNYHRHAAIAERLEALGATEDGEEGAEIDLEGKDPDEVFEHAILTLEQNGPDEAFGLFEALAKAAPEHADAQLVFGQLLLSRDDAQRAEHHLERAIAIEPGLTHSACDSAIRYWMQRNEHDAAQRWIDRAEVWGHKLDQANYERAVIDKKDVFLPHDLDDEQLASLREAIEMQGGIKHVWLVQKKLEHFPDEELFVLGVRFKRTMGLAWNEEEKLAALANNFEFHAGMRLFNVGDSDHRWLKKYLKRVPHSQLT